MFYVPIDITNVYPNVFLVLVWFAILAAIYQVTKRV